MWSRRRPAGEHRSFEQALPRKSPVITSRDLVQLVDQLNREHPQDLLQEFRDQNQELLHTLEELRKRQEELTHLNRELEDTNRGVVALYAELDEKADHLRRADEVKSRFLSNMSHEFRTPLNSILALSRLLLDRTDGELGSEQEKQVFFIRKSAESLSELVNDLLDLAKVEAGKITVRPIEFEVSNMFGALRGMLRPLLLNTAVNLVFEEPERMPTLATDEGKVSQILRNFISNALKFTEYGEVKVSANLDEDGRNVVFSVTDTGIGIAKEDQEIIFQEFAQLDSALQRKVKGTGLGLPLSRKLAELLGGKVWVDSEASKGSTFFASIPVMYLAPVQIDDDQVTAPAIDSSRIPVLVVEDQYESRLIYEKYLKHSIYQMIPARTMREADDALAKMRPAAVILDVLLQGEDTWELLATLKSNPATHDIPVIMVTNVQDQRKAVALGADYYASKPVEREWLLETLNRATSRLAPNKVLIIDDQEISRYILKQILARYNLPVIEAPSGEEGLRLAHSEMPALIVLDLSMPGIHGVDVLTQLKESTATRDIPVIVSTSRSLSHAEGEELLLMAKEIISKRILSSDEGLQRLRDILNELALLQSDSELPEPAVRATTI